MNSEKLESALEDFRAWSVEWDEVEETDFPEPPVDFAALVGGFAALRHEVNLQTKSARNSLEQTGETVKLLQDRAQAGNATSSTDQTRPFVKTMIDVYDQLSLAVQGVDKHRKASPPAANDLHSPVVRTGIWARLFARKPTVLPDEAWSVQDDQVKTTVDALLTGYQMSMSRIDRLLTQQGLEVVASVGLPFDPEVMEAIEVVSKTEAPSGMVVAEIRRGYRWNGQMFRFAQVKVAR